MCIAAIRRRASPGKPLGDLLLPELPVRASFLLPQSSRCHETALKSSVQTGAPLRAWYARPGIAAAGQLRDESPRRRRPVNCAVRRAVVSPAWFRSPPCGSRSQLTAGQERPDQQRLGRTHRRGPHSARDCGRADTATRTGSFPHSDTHGAHGGRMAAWRGQGGDRRFMSGRVAAGRRRRFVRPQIACPLLRLLAESRLQSSV